MWIESVTFGAIVIDGKPRMLRSRSLRTKFLVNSNERAANKAVAGAGAI